MCTMMIKFLSWLCLRVKTLTCQLGHKMEDNVGVRYSSFNPGILDRRSHIKRWIMSYTLTYERFNYDVELILAFVLSTFQVHWSGGKEENTRAKFRVLSIIYNDDFCQEMCTVMINLLRWLCLRVKTLTCQLSHKMEDNVGVIDSSFNPGILDRRSHIETMDNELHKDL